MKLLPGSFLPILVLAISTTGCSGIFGFGDAEPIKVITEPPASEQCEFIAQAVGMGSGGIFGAESGREDAEDNLKKIAEQREGNVVQIVQTQSRVHSDDGEALETILTGHVYRCP